MMTSILLYCGLLLLGMLLALETGRCIGTTHLRRDPEGAGKGIGALEGAIFALFGLLLAFTFSGAASRFDQRRELIGQEANAIGTAYLRLDLLSDEAQQKLRPLFREYVESRLATFRHTNDAVSTTAEIVRDQKLQGRIWQEAIGAAKQTNIPTVLPLVLTPINDMIDITTTRLVHTKTHPPQVVYIMLFSLALVASLLVGYGLALSRTRQWTHILAFALVIVGTVYVILDLEYPRQGFIRVDAADRVLIDLLHSMQVPDANTPLANP